MMNQDDILYILSGKGKMWVDGISKFELQKGKLIRC
jgi:quercetin dioxygenase-like cupin family protein